MRFELLQLGRVAQVQPAEEAARATANAAVPAGHVARWTCAQMGAVVRVTTVAVHLAMEQLVVVVAECALVVVAVTVFHRMPADPPWTATRREGDTAETAPGEVPRRRGEQGRCVR